MRTNPTRDRDVRDPWQDACGAVVFLSFLMIVAHVAFPPLFGLTVPYAGGAAVVLGAGATLSLGLRSRSTRLPAAVALVGLLGLRLLSALRPDLLISKHGALSLMDGIAMALLMLAVVILIGVAFKRPYSGPNKPLHRPASPAAERQGVMPTTAESLLETRNGVVWLATTGPPFEFVSPFGSEEFALMVVVADANVSANDQNTLSGAFVAQGCRYAVCAGHDCSSWDDSIDWAFISTDPSYCPPDDRFVMTSWHEHEPLSDTAWFFLWNTAFDDFVPSRFVALVIGGDTTSKRVVEDALRVAAADGVDA